MLRPPPRETITSRHVIAGTSRLGTLEAMDTYRDPANVYRAWQDAGPPPVRHAEVDRLLAHLEQRPVDLDRLHREFAEARRPWRTLPLPPRGSRGCWIPFGVLGPCCRDRAGGECVHVAQLLKQRRLGHLKIGARTLTTAEHLAQFREASEVAAPAPQRANANHPRSVDDQALQAKARAQWL